MRSPLVVAFLLAFAACTAPPPSDGDALACVPDQSSCMGGNTLTQCTHSGRDFIRTTCPGSGTNPGVCQTGAGCPTGAGACCVRTKPVCGVSLATLTHADGGAEEPNHACTEVPQWCSSSGALTVMISPASSCDGGSPDGTSVRLSVRRPVAIGQTITLPSPDVALSTLSLDVARACSSWVGTVTVQSEVPAWNVALIASCTESGKDQIRVAGQFSGTL